MDCPYVPEIVLSLHKGTTDLTPCLDIKPLTGCYQIGFIMDRHRVPEALFNILGTTTIEFDCTLSESSCPEKSTIQHNAAPLASCCTELGVAYHARYLHIGSTDDVTLHLTYSTLALGLSGQSYKDQARALLNVGLALVLRAKHEKDKFTIDYAVEVHRHAIRVMDSIDALSLNLAEALFQRSARFGGYKDAMEAIELLERASNECPPGHSSRAQITVDLSHCLHLRYIMLAQLDDLNRALTLARECLALWQPRHPERCRIILLLSILLTQSFDRTGNEKDLDTAVHHAEYLIESCPPGHMLRANALSLLSTALYNRSRLTDCAEALDKALLAAQECLKANRNLPIAYNSLANILDERYNRYGNFDDIDASIRLRRTQLELDAPGSPNYVGALTNLASSLHAKSDYSLDSKHLDEAIVLLRQALSLCSVEHRWHRHISTNLAECLNRRSVRNQTAEDLQEALQLQGEWLSNSSTQEAEPPMKNWMLSSAAAVRQTSFQYFGNRKNLDIAIEILEEACYCSSHGQGHLQLNMPSMIGRLGSCYGLRAALTGLEADGIKALTLMNQALKLLPTASPHRAELSFELAKLYSIQGTAFRDPSNALDAYSGAIADAMSPAATRLVEGIKALETIDTTIHTGPYISVTIKQEVSKKLLQAYQSTIQLLPQVAYFGLDPHARIQALAHAPTVAASAAAHAAESGQTESAVELLEEGRTVFWTQNLRMRTPLDELPKEMAAKIKSTIDQLEFQSKHLGDESAVESEARSTKQRELSQKLTKLIDSVRSLPGLDRFMLPDSFASIARAAERVPVLVLVATSRFCGGILIQDASTQPIQLRFDPLLSSKCIQKMYGALHGATRKHQSATRGRAIRYESSKFDNFDSLLRDMWTMLVQHVVRELGWKRSCGTNRPRLTICSTGLFTHLPVHAAGAAKEHVWDYFVPSYTPTLGALVTANSKYKPVHKNSALTLLAAVSNPFKGDPLPNVLEEVELIQRIFPKGQVLNVPQHPALAPSASASCQDVLDNLPQVSMVHLACHGHHDAKNSLQSGFIMRDKMLTITDLMGLDLPNSFFAFLSACETAKNAQSQPDQAINLAAAMLFAGFKSVIGTMW